MFTICVRPPNDSMLLLEKTEPAQHDRVLCHVDSFPPDLSNTLPLYNNLNYNEFPKVHNLSHLHFQPSQESRIQ